MILFLDDTRLPEHVGLKSTDCVIVRTADEAQATLQQNPVFDSWSLDHDLGLGSLTGYEFLKWVADHALDKWPKGMIKVHSANPVGTKNMEVFIRNEMSKGTSSQIPRHKTAIARNRLSRPARLALGAELVSSRDTYLDYGCGRGGDVQRLQQRGIEAIGWDPYWRPEPAPVEADVVACVYVINVIEALEERAEALLRAWALTRRTLVVAARVDKPTYVGVPFGDGVLTGIGTFQHFYTQKSLQEYIEQTLSQEPKSLGSGVFLLEKATPHQATVPDPDRILEKEC